MKRLLVMVALALLLSATVYAAFTNPEANIRWNRSNILRENGPLSVWMAETETYVGGTATLPDRLRIGEISAPSGNPSANTGWLYAKDAAGTSTLYFEDDAGTVTALGNSFTGGSITSDLTFGNGVDILSTTTNGHTNSLGVRDIDGAAYVDVLRWTNANAPTIVMGNANGTTAITSSDWAISATGAATGMGAITMDGLLTGTLGATITGAAISLNNSSNFAVNIGTGTTTTQVTIGGGSNRVDVASDSWDVTNGAVSGVTTLGMSGDLTMANGKAIQGSTTIGETIKMKAYDNDTGPAYVDALTITNGNAPSISFGNNATTVAVNSTDWDIDATGAMTGIGAITMDGLLTGTLGATITGAAVALNASSNFAVNIGTGTTTAQVTLGGGSNRVDVASDTWDVTNGAVSGVVSITGAGTGALGGFKMTVTDDNNGKTLAATESGTVQTNAGAVGSAAWTLPEAAAGLTYTFIVGAAQELRITPDAGDKINHAGTAAANGEYYWADAIGESVTIVAIDSSTWVVTAQTGTWSEQTP